MFIQVFGNGNYGMEIYHINLIGIFNNNFTPPPHSYFSSTVIIPMNL